MSRVWHFSAFPLTRYASKFACSFVSRNTLPNGDQTPPPQGTRSAPIGVGCTGRRPRSRKGPPSSPHWCSKRCTPRRSRSISRNCPGMCPLGSRKRALPPRTRTPACLRPRGIRGNGNSRRDGGPATQVWGKTPRKAGKKVGKSQAQHPLCWGRTERRSRSNPRRGKQLDHWESSLREEILEKKSEKNLNMRYSNALFLKIRVVQLSPLIIFIFFLFPKNLKIWGIQIFVS